MFDFFLMQGPPAHRGHNQAPRDGVSDLLDRCLLAKRHACIGAADAVELNDLLPPLLLEGGHRFGDGFCAALDFQHVAGRSTDLSQCVGIDPNDAASHIIAPGFDDRQAQLVAILCCFVGHGLSTSGR
ncbi:hypothetical protein GALL_490920 [mine drainage metagenome]|uniref:Uncharacterized protein n=1 Tax=mine drainage metagenome TaxID=410659 RepID=A0A1J5PVJ0_9ZZZZ